MTSPLRSRMAVLAAAIAVTMAAILVAPAATPAAHAGINADNLVAFQANTGILWTVSEIGVGHPTGLAMRTSTSPFIRPGYHGSEISFQANTGVLWTVSAGVGRSTGLNMKHGTSPRGTGAPGDQIAFQGLDGTLWIYRNGVGRSTGFRMRAATSPDILPDPGGGFWMAFQSDTGELKVVDPAGVLHPTGHQMRAGTNPDLSPFGYGIMLACQAVGAVLASGFAPVLTERLGREGALVVTAALIATSETVLATVPSVYAADAALALFACGTVTWNVVVVVLRQTLVPQHLLGRANSVYRLVAWGGLPVGAAAGGVVAAEAGTTAVFGGGAAVMAVVAVVLLVGARRRWIARAEQGADTAL